MSNSALIEAFGHIVLCFTRGVTEHFNPEEPDFTAESFGYNPLESTGREWYYQPVDELIYQEYSDREATSSDYLVSGSLNVKVINASSPEENEGTRGDRRDDDISMAWKRLRPSVTKTVCKSMYIGALITLLSATFLGTIFISTSYVCYKTKLNCYYSRDLIPKRVKWSRVISTVILNVFIYAWNFTLALFLFRSFQTVGLKKKLFLVSLVFYCLDSLYRVALEAILKTDHSDISTLTQSPPIILFLVNVCFLVYFICDHFCTRSRKQKLILFLQMMVAGCFTYIVGGFTVYFMYPMYNKQDKLGKLLMALFTPLIGVALKVISRICVQRLYNITHPGHSHVLLVPLYFGSAVIFRALQADLGSLKYIALLGIIHGAAEVLERSTMVLVDHIGHMLWKRTLAAWGSFRTPRRERLMADIAIMSMLYESTAIVSVNGFLYLYQFIYLQDKSLLSLLQSFAVYTLVQLMIEWFSTSVSLAIETRYQNMAVMAVWRRRWRRHLLVAIANTVPLAIWTSGNLFTVVHGRFNEPSSQPCKMPFV